MFTNEINHNDQVAHDLLVECGKLQNGTFTFEMKVDSGQVYSLSIERDLITYEFQETGQDN